MYESLATGVANRSVSVADLNIAEAPEGADPQMAAGFADDRADGVSTPGGLTGPSVWVQAPYNDFIAFGFGHRQTA